MADVLLPAAFRIVLLYIANDPSEDDEDGVGWKSDWKQFCREDLGVEDDPDDLDEDEAKDVWVDYAVRRYCETRAFVEKTKQMIPGQTHD